MNLNTVNQIVTKRLILIIVIFNYLSTTVCNLQAQDHTGGGMYPISLLKDLDLKDEGLILSVDEVYNTDEVTLLNAIVRIGGCTGSFVSDQGLILTNHHCVFSSLKPHSSEGNNLMESGYVAKSKEQELPMYGTELKIMRGYEDISDRVLKGMSKVKDAAEKAQTIENRISSLESEYNGMNDGFKYEISEMLTGDSYILFKYQIFKDLRLVYVPPRTLGEFGGATDNWEWPRHSGDFSFVRAYVGKDGKPAEYSEENIPFTPDKYLKVEPKGVEENEFVFILGYPGRTYKHQPAEFIRYQEEVLMPFIVDVFQYRIETLQAYTEESEKLKIKYDPKIKRLENTEKNFRGKLEGLEAINLYETKKAQEKAMVDKIKNENLAYIYGDFSKTLEAINNNYTDIINRGKKSLWYGQVLDMSDILQLARSINSYQSLLIGEKEAKQPWKEIPPSEDYIKGIEKLYKSIDYRLDSAYLRHMLMMASNFEDKNKIEGFDDIFSDKKTWKEVDEFISEYYEDDILDSAEILGILRDEPYKIVKLKSEVLDLWKELEKDFISTSSANRATYNEIDALYPEYVTTKQDLSDKIFVPDANATLRLTYGRIKGYSPRDGVHYEPFTTLSGYKEKVESGNEDYKGLPELISAADNTATSTFVLPGTDQIPMCILYNTDTSGGNSGSPILNSVGELIGLNFDRSYSATINDFAWNDKYSRSIGVDIRFILWYAKNIGDAGYLLEEMEAM